MIDSKDDQCSLTPKYSKTVARKKQYDLDMLLPMTK